MGLLGALFVELTVYRRHHRAAWTRGVWGGVVVVTIAQLCIGFLNLMVDQWAHLGGLLVGAVLGLALSPHSRWPKAGRHAARGIAVVFGAAVAIATVMVVRTSLVESLERSGSVLHVVDDVAVTAPTSWQSKDGQLYQPDGVVVAAFLVKPGTRTELLAKWLEDVQGHDREEFDQVELATDRIVTLPAGWEGNELALSAPFPDPIGGRLHDRTVVAARAFGDRVVLVRISAPETVMRNAPDLIARLLASVTIR
jgi:hypothetical protein